MRLRTFLLLIGVLAIVGLIIVLVIANNSGDGIAGILPGGNGESTGEISTPSSPEGGQEPGLPAPTATPAVRLEPVVIAARSLPVGERLREDLLMVEMRPNSNIALQGGYTFSEIDELLGEIVKTNIAEGQSILAPMIALNPTDLAATGSDISLYVDQGKVAVAFPIDELSGAAFAMRPGDMVDVLMSMPVVELDPEYNTKLPNITQRVDDLALAEGTDFLFPEALEGRLELVEPLNMVGEVSGPIGEDEESKSTQVPRRITQLTIQQAEVVWIGTWQDPLELERRAAEAAAEAELAATTNDIPVPTPTPLPERLEAEPDIVILTMTAQDALSLKWSLERGLDIDLALRAPGDTTVFATNSVSLPVLVDNGALRIPEKSDFGVDPSLYKLDFPKLDEDE